MSWAVKWNCWCYMNIYIETATCAQSVPHLLVDRNTRKLCIFMQNDFDYIMSRLYYFCLGWYIIYFIWKYTYTYLCICILFRRKCSLIGFCNLCRFLLLNCISFGQAMRTVNIMSMSSAKKNYIWYACSESL